MAMNRGFTEEPSGDLPDHLARVKSYVLSVGESAVDIAVSILALVIVGRFYGPEGMGVYTFLMSVFVIVVFLSEVGIDKWIEKELASEGQIDTSRMLAEAKGAVLLSGLAGCLAMLIFGAWASKSPTVAGGTWPGFVLLALAVPLNLRSGLQVSVLHGQGKPGEAARAGFVKRSVFLASVFTLAYLRFRPELLMAGFVLSEAASLASARRRVRMPSIGAVLKRIRGVGETFRMGSQYYFTHEALKVLFFVDFFILGLFVSATQEGSYAQASVLARFFLLIPLGAAPLYRVKVYRASGSGQGEIFSDSARTAARLFTLHSMAGLLFLLYFPHVLRVVFRVQGDTPVFFQVFSLLLPGLLLFASTLVLEPFFGASGREEDLNRIALRVFILNAFLNSYLIPYAGVIGAATATTISLSVYFVLFSRELGEIGTIPLGSYLLSGILVYVSYHVLFPVQPYLFIVLPLVFVVLPVLFWVLGLFGQGQGKRQLRIES